VKTRLIILGLVAVAGVAAVLALSSTFPSPFSSPNRPSPTAFIVMGQSSCTAHQSNFTCTLVLSRSTGQVSTADVSSVQINGTKAQISGMTATEDSVSVNAGISIAAIGRGLSDLNMPPVTIAEVTVYLKDGTTVSASLPGQYAE